MAIKSFILSADFGKLGRLPHGADAGMMLHYDVMDGHCAQYQLCSVPGAQEPAQNLPDAFMMCT